MSGLYYSCLESLASVSVCTKMCFISCGQQESLKYALLCNVWLANLLASLLARGSDFMTELVNLRLSGESASSEDGLRLPIRWPG